MSDPSYPVYPIFAFIGFVIVIIPLPWHLQAWNSGTCLYMVWTAVACLNQFVNSVVWHGNLTNRAPIWCDISSRLMIGVAVAIPSASLCINRRLYKIASIQTASITRKDKQRAVLIDLLIGVGIPLVEMALQYVVEGHRYDIYEDIGCYPVTYITPVAFPLVIVWPLVIGLVSAAYCVLTLRAFLKRRAQFNELLSTHSSLTMNRYFRLMALASADLLCTVPYSAYGVFLNITTTEIRPWLGWADTHFNYSKVDQIPAAVWRSNHQVEIALELSRWFLIVCAFIFFMFFGFAGEARKNYRIVFTVCSHYLKPSSQFSRKDDNQNNSLLHLPKTMGISGALPIYVPRSSCDSSSNFASSFRGEKLTSS